MQRPTMGPLLVALRARGTDRRTLTPCRTVISPFRQPGASKVDPFRSCMPWYAMFTISHEIHTKKKKLKKPANRLSQVGAPGARK